MINIPKNKPASIKHDAAKDSARRDALVERVLAGFSKGMQSVNLGGRGGNGITEKEAREVGRMFVDKAYFANLIYSVDGRFNCLVVSKTCLHNVSGAKAKPLPAAERPDVEVEVDVDEVDIQDVSQVEPDVFVFNGEPVVAVSDPAKPYVLYRRAYPHKPKWIVADSTHRVIGLLPLRCHAQAVMDELNSLSAK